MQLSKSTLEVLKNFATINTNILLREGSDIRTVSAGTNIFALATVEEEFPKDIPIYDLNPLLTLLSLADGEEIEFGEKSLKIPKNDGEFEFFYADTSAIKVAPNKTIEVEEHFSFDLTKSDIDTINKMAGVIQASTINIVAAKGVVSLILGDPETPSTNSYKKTLGKFKGTFDARLEISNMRIIPMDYKVTLSKKKFIHFHNEERQLQYWMALTTKSVI